MSEHDDSTPRPSLDTAVRRRRTDESFFLRIAAAIQQNERAVQRLTR